MRRDGLKIWRCRWCGRKVSGLWGWFHKPEKCKERPSMRIIWCAYHKAEVVNPRSGECWDAERFHDCEPVEARVEVPE